MTRCDRNVGGAPVVDVSAPLELLTPHRPFGYETSFSIELRDHTGQKTEALLEAKAAAAIADNAAFVFIDAIDPIGTLNPAVHERMGRVFGKLEPYYEHLGGDRVADVAIDYSLEWWWRLAHQRPAGAAEPGPSVGDFPPDRR